MPTIVVKDAMRSAVESASGGKQTIIYSASGKPNIMNIIEKSALPADYSDHPAFVVGGVNKTRIFIGTYIGAVSDGELISRPNLGAAYGSLPTFNTYARACGAGFHVMTNVEWAALQLIAQSQGVVPRMGNENWGLAPDGVNKGIRTDGSIPGTNTDLNLYRGDTLGGSGPVAWRHDNSPTGICDLRGNMYEHSPGIMRQATTQVLLIKANNNAALSTDNPAPADANWKAISGTTGALVDPTAADAIRLNLYNTITDTTYSLSYLSEANLQAAYFVTGSGIGDAAKRLLYRLGILIPYSNQNGWLNYPTSMALGGVAADSAAINAGVLRGGSYRESVGFFGFRISNDPFISAWGSGARLAYYE